MPTFAETLRQVNSGQVDFLRIPELETRNNGSFPYSFPWNGTTIEIATWEKTYRVWWENKYSPFIPAKWLAKPRKIPIQNQDLAPKEIEALLTESNEIYALALAFNRKLSSDELALVFAHPRLSFKSIFDLSYWQGHRISAIKIMSAQQSLGMKDEEVKAAMIKAKTRIKSRFSDSNESPVNISRKIHGDKRGETIVLSGPFGPFEVFRTNHDVEKEIKIPTEIDKDTAAVLGIAYGCGHLNKGYLRLCTPVANRRLFEEKVGGLFSKVFNLPFKEPQFKLSRKQKGDGTMVLLYQSSLVGSFFVDYLGYPKNKGQKRQTGLPIQIKNAEQDIKDEFLKYFLATGASFDSDGFIDISSSSEPLLEDVKKLIEERTSRKLRKVEKRKRETTDSYILTIPHLLTGELFLKGFLNENSVIWGKAESFFRQKIESSAWTKNHLERVCPEEMKKYQKRVIYIA